MIPNYEDRLVYLCNYILKNYYRKQSGASFYRMYDYQVKLMQNNDWNIVSPKQLPFSDKKDDIQVIINGHRYNLS